MRPALPRAALPVGLLVLGLAGMMVLLAGRPADRRQPPPDTRRLVRTTVATASDVPLVVRSEGTVTARTESDLVAEVAGRVVFVSPALRPGGFFAAEDVLLRIEPRDYQVGLKRAQAALERSQGELELAEQNLARQEGLRLRDAASRSAYDEAASRARVSRAARLDAEAALEQAALDLGRTELRTPFAGRVLEKYIDLGQFASRGTRVARTYAIDIAEVRLPLSDEDLAYLDIPLGSRAGAGALDGPEVVLSTRFAGSEHQWRGRIVRTEGRIDPRTRMVNVVVEVADPYGRSNDGEDAGVPLAVGLFVSAEIRGTTARSVVPLPREALRRGNRVLVVDAEERLRFRDVSVLRREHDRVLVRSGLNAGEVVCISPLEAPVDGMRVRTGARIAVPMTAREGESPGVAAGP